jgi:translocation and assembly module TamB
VTRRRWQLALVFLALLVPLGALALRTERAGAYACRLLRERLPELVDGEVRLGRCELDPLTLSVQVQEVDLRRAGATSPLVTARSARVSLRGLFLGGVSLQDVVLVRPELDLVLPEDPVPGAPGACVLDALQAVRVGSLRLEEGRLRLRRGVRELLLEGVGVRARLGRKDGELTVDARSGSVTVQEGRTLHLGKLTLEAALDLEGRQLDLQRGEIDVEGLTASLSGQVDRLCESWPELSLRGQVFLPLDALGRLGVQLPGPTGQVWARLAASGRADALAVRAEIQASQVVIGAYAPGDFSAKVVWSDKRVILEEFTTRSGEGDLKVTGELQLTEGLPVKARLETHEASFARVMARASVPGAWVEFPATVKGGVTGHLLPEPSLAGDFEFRTGAFLLAARAFDAPRAAGRDILAFPQAKGTFHFGVSGSAVTFDSVALTVGAQERTHVTGRVRLAYDSAVGLDIAAVADPADLSDFGSISGLPWSGVGTVRTSVVGPYGRVGIEGSLALRDFKFDGYSLGVLQSPLRLEGKRLTFPAVSAQKGQSQYFGDLALDFGPAELQVRSTVQLPEGRVEDLVDLLADLHPVVETLRDGTLTGGVSLLAAVDSPASALSGVIAARVHDTLLLERRLGDTELLLRFDHGEALVLEPAVFEGPLGRLEAEGRWGFDGPLAYRLDLTRGSVAELLDPGGAAGWPVGGDFTARARVGGDTSQVLVDGWFSSPQVTLRGRGLGASHLEGRLVGRDFTAFGPLLPGIQGTLGLAFRGDWPYTTTVALDVPDLGPFLPAQLSGRVQGSVKAAGPMRQIRLSRGEAVLQSLTLARGEVTATSTAPVELGWNAGALHVRALTMKGPTTEFTAEGRWGPTTADLQSRGSVDLRLVASAVAAVERTQGRLDFNATLTGPVKAPALAGSAELTDGRFWVKGQDLQVRALTGRADFSDSRVLLQDVQGFLNEGRLRGRGDFKLERLDFRTADLQLDLEDVTAQILPEVPVTVSGSLQLATRTGATWQLQGGLDVQKLRYTKTLALDSVLASASRGLPSDEKPDEWLRLDVDLATAGDVRVDNNLARARLAGKLKLTGTNVRPLLVGAVETGDGAQAFFRGNTFSVSRGVLQFNGQSPTFDLSAQSQVREYLVSVKAFGRLDDPRVALSSEPGLPETDILSLLTLGVTSRERLTGQSGAGLAAEALLSASGLDQQVQRFLSSNVGLKDQQVRLTTSYNEVTGTVEPAVTWESKVVSDNLKVGITQPVTGRGTKAQAEYRFDQRVSARAQWDNQNQNTSVGNPGIDLRFRFEWE